jgi:hypothetical protein
MQGQSQLPSLGSQVGLEVQGEKEKKQDAQDELF